ncbi:hypothetical protein [Roseococcus sp.]|uniref:hypothetical protein n=1 Tax=Roseococcus sp. TaxID=2109646 RepID=UPI003BA92A1E
MPSPAFPPRRAVLSALVGAALLHSVQVQAQDQGVRLFRVVGPRDEVTIGFTAAELEAMGAGPDVERIARKLVAEGQVTAWQYAVGRAPDGSTRFGTTRRVAILRNETLRIESYTAAIPVAPPPAS